MTFVLMQNTSLPKYRPLSSTPKAAYLPITSYIFLTSETRQLVNSSTCQLNENKMENKQYTEQELQQLHGVFAVGPFGQLRPGDVESLIHRVQSVQHAGKFLLAHAARRAAVPVAKGAGHITDIGDLHVNACIHIKAAPFCAYFSISAHKSRWSEW